MILSVLRLLSSCNTRDKNSEFYHLTTSNFSTSSYFICIDVICKDSLYTVVIQNNDFFDILFTNFKISSQELYTKKVLFSLINNKPFIVDTSTLNILKKGYIIEKDYKLDSIIGLDEDSLLNKYFTNNIFNSKIHNFQEQKKVIFSLFKHQIPCLQQCVSGNICVKNKIITN